MPHKRDKEAASTMLIASEPYIRLPRTPAPVPPALIKAAVAAIYNSLNNSTYHLISFALAHFY